MEMTWLRKGNRFHEECDLDLRRGRSRRQPVRVGLDWKELGRRQDSSISGEREPIR